MDLTVVIPTRKEQACLFFTLQMLREQEVDLDRIQVSVMDNEPEYGKDNVAAADKMLKRASFPNSLWLAADRVKSPYHPRDEGAKNCSSPWVLFIDSHVILCRGFLQELLNRLPSTPENSITHFPVSFGGPTMYGHYKLQMGGLFWGDWQPLVEKVLPYPIAASGIWAFLVNRSFYLDVLEGFNPNFQGYSGGEPYLDLKCWMLGGQVRMDSSLYGIHYSGPRGYQAKWEERVRNFALAISVVAPSRLQTFSTAIQEKTGLPPLTIEGLIQAGVKAGEEEAARFRKKMRMPLEDVVMKWRQEGVPF